MTRRILHFGCRKTGTTYLQSTPWRSRESLQALGVELPLDRVSPFHLEPPATVRARATVK
ncbi:MAG TPA: hypothetical protein VFR22_15900 [Nocardioidaceae bacterium]|nr:hypothetical protein [Nocardioidaceae bacterium]